MKYLVKVESDKDEIGSIFVEIEAITPEIAVSEVQSTLIFTANPFVPQKESR